MSSANAPAKCHAKDGLGQQIERQPAHLLTGAPPRRAPLRIKHAPQVFEVGHYQMVLQQIAVYAEILRDHLRALADGENEDCTPDTHRKFVGLAVMIGALADDVSGNPHIGNASSWAVGDAVTPIEVTP